MKNHTKQDLIREVENAVGLTPSDAERIVRATFFDCLAESLRNGEEIEIRGFGSFRIRQRRGRIGRNPRSGVTVEVPPKTIVFFVPSKDFSGE